MSALIRVALLVACVAFATRASAEPACAPARSEGAQEALTAGLSSYRAALGKTIDEGKLRGAIADFDRSCALGEPKALEWRAFAFIALGDYEHAAESLVAFTRASGYAALAEEDRDRVREALDAINDAGVAPKISVFRVTTTPEASVRIDGVHHGLSPVTALVRADRVVVEASANGYEDSHREVDTSAGGEAQTAIELARPLRTETLARRRSSAEREPPSEWPLRLGIAAGVTAAATVGFTVWRESGVSAYDEMPCPANRAAATGECASVLGAFETARTLQMTSLVVTLALAGTAVTWWLLDREHRPASTTMAFIQPLLPRGLEF